MPKTAEATASERAGQQRHWLGLATDHVMTRGIAGLSLRELALAIGTSHRVLIYYFGSKDEMFEQILLEFRRRGMEHLNVFAETSSDPRKALRAVWEYDKSRAPQFRLVFEMLVLALSEPKQYGRFLEGTIDAWMPYLETALLRAGVPRSRIRERARLVVAVTRGLYMDYVVTGQVWDVDAAYEEFIRLVLSKGR